MGPTQIVGGIIAACKYFWRTYLYERI